VFCLELNFIGGLHRRLGLINLLSLFEKAAGLRKCERERGIMLLGAATGELRVATDLEEFPWGILVSMFHATP
jgi:hypothetical protein